MKYFKLKEPENTKAGGILAAVYTVFFKLSYFTIHAKHTLFVLMGQRIDGRQAECNNVNNGD